MSTGQTTGDDAAPPLDLPHLIRTTAAVVIGRAQMAQRQVRRGDDLAKLDGHFAAIEAAMRALIGEVERVDEPRR